MAKKTIPYALLRNEVVGPGLKRILEAMGDDAQELAVSPESQLPEAVHHLRILIKRLRAYLWFIRPILGRPRCTLLTDRLRKAAGQLSQARDLEIVQGALKKAALPDSLEKDLQALSQVSLAVVQKQASHAQSSVETLRLVKKSAATVVRVVTKVQAALDKGKKTWPAPESRATKAFRAASKAQRKAAKKAAFSAVHTWRKKTKRLLYVLQLTHRLPQMENDDYLKLIDRLQETLGEHQDSVIAETHVRLQAGSLDATELAATLRLLDQKRESLLKEALEQWAALPQNL